MTSGPTFLALALLLWFPPAARGRPCTDPPSRAAARPNLVVILADDLGFSDVGPYGSEIETPHLDALAARGLRFTQAYNTGRCCPTRASLLTGLYPHQTGVGHMTADQEVPGYRGRLNASCRTLAEVLGAAGYFTAMTGKWHVGFDHGVTPASRGFHRSLNLPAGGVYYANDSRKCRLHLNGEPIANDDPRLPAAWYGTDLWTTFGIRFVDEALAAKQPFFLYLAHVAPHFPLQAPAEDIARFRGRYARGWDELARERHARQVASGLIDPAWRPAERPEEIREFAGLRRGRREAFDHLMAVYAATVFRMDRAIGALVRALEERGVLDDTVIVFLSDNGGNAESGPKGRMEGDPTRADSTWFCGQSWAHLQNAPFRRYKHHVHEGGIATPLIVHWPARIREARWVHAPAHVIDLAPTLYELAGATHPAGDGIKPLEGRSLVPLFDGGSELPARTLYWEHEGHAALRVGDEKLVRYGLDGPWELYDLAKDRTEQFDLAPQRAERVAEFTALWEAWAQRTHVLPRPTKEGVDDEDK